MTLITFADLERKLTEMDLRFLAIEERLRQMQVPLAERKDYRKTAPDWLMDALNDVLKGREDISIEEAEGELTGSVASRYFEEAPLVRKTWLGRCLRAAGFEIYRVSRKYGISKRPERFRRITAK